MFGCLSSCSREISLMAVLGIPSSACSNLIFLSATIYEQLLVKTCYSYLISLPVSAVVHYSVRSLAKFTHAFVPLANFHRVIGFRGRVGCLICRLVYHSHILISQHRIRIFKSFNSKLLTTIYYYLLILTYNGKDLKLKHRFN